MNKFSVCSSVYKNDNTDHVKDALDSMLVNQSIKPDEIIIIQDGPIPFKLSNLLSVYEAKYSDIIHIIRLEENKGLGNALKIGVENAKYNIIARMDSDDICLPDRFEKQLTYLETHKECDILGGQMTEFIGNPSNIVCKREVPLMNNEIYSFMKNRCSLNHVTVMFRKQSVINAGNYQDWFWNEDYYLWVRMMINGCNFANLPDVLVNVRTGREQYARRGGRKYFESEKGIKKIQLKYKMITKKEYFFYVIERYIVQILMPNCMRGWIFRIFARR